MVDTADETDDNEITRLLRCFIEPMQEVATAFRQLRLLRWIDTATGHALGLIGKLVGEPPTGLDDEVYRRYVRARISANNSNGLIEDLLTVADLVVYDDDAQYIVLNWGNAYVKFSVAGILLDFELAGILIRFLTDSIGDGIRIVADFDVVADADSFKWDVSADGLGWGDELDAGVGGGWASAIEVG